MLRVEEEKPKGKTVEGHVHAVGSIAVKLANGRHNYLSETARWLASPSCEHEYFFHCWECWWVPTVRSSSWKEDHPRIWLLGVVPSKRSLREHLTHFSGLIAVCVVHRHGCASEWTTHVALQSCCVQQVNNTSRYHPATHAWTWHVTLARSQ